MSDGDARQTVQFAVTVPTAQALTTLAAAIESAKINHKEIAARREGDVWKCVITMTLEDAAATTRVGTWLTTLANGVEGTYEGWSEGEEASL